MASPNTLAIRAPKKKAPKFAHVSVILGDPDKTGILRRIGGDGTLRVRPVEDGKKLTRGQKKAAKRARR